MVTGAAAEPLAVQTLAARLTRTVAEQAIERRELVMHYQPILDIAASCWEGVEALVGGSTRAAASWIRTGSSRWPRRPV
jgi:sensor c-di-GMP phosphodiesterase-like protein